MTQKVLPIFYWEEDFDGEPTVMTACVPYKDTSFGLSFPIDDNATRKNMDKKKLMTHMKEIVSVLTLHGDAVIDSYGEIDPRLVSDEEAKHGMLDPMWAKKVKAVDGLIRFKEITKEQAKEFNLI